MDAKKKSQRRERRMKRVRTRIFGSAVRPRMSVYRSLKNIYVQLIDDVSGRTIVSESSKHLKLKKNNIETAKKVGEAVAKAAKSSGISKVVFDKSFYKFHGRVKALADAAREHGLKF